MILTEDAPDVREMTIKPGSGYLSDEAANRMTELALARRESVQVHGNNQIIEAAGAVSATVALGAFYQLNTMDIVFANEVQAFNSLLISGLIGMALSAGSYFCFSSNKTSLGMTAKECDLEMYAISRKYPHAFEGRVHQYDETPKRYELEQSRIRRLESC